MADVLDWLGATDRRAVIDRAVQVLKRGELVAFPTDTIYAVAASALESDAIERLAGLRGADGSLAVAVAGAGQALDWVPRMSPLGRRLARRCWPGPVTLVFADDIDAGQANQLPDEVRQRLCPEREIGLWVPGHDAPWEALRLAGVPLAFAHLPCNGSPPTADLVNRLVGAQVPLIVDGGPSRDTKASSVVRVAGECWNVVREGVVSAAELAEQTTCVIVFVCTGNTCRSPMAEALCAKLLAERLGCAVAELPQRGYLVVSAGVAALPEDDAAHEAVEAVKELGADLSRHRSQPLTAELVLHADHLITMTQSHAAAVAVRFGRQGPEPQLLCPEGGEIADPIGRDQEVYRACARQILQHLERLVPELLPS